MANETAESSNESKPSSEEGRTIRFAVHIDTFVHIVELAAAGIFALLFAIGVVDLGLRIVQAIRSGQITSPAVVIRIIDTGLLLLIIVEVYQTVMAYIRQNDTRYIVRLILYTGIIAMVRKVIIYRTDDYPTMQNALIAAVAYTLILIGLGAVLLVELRNDDQY